MKRMVQRISSLVLSAALLGGIVIPASASDALGEEMSQKNVQIHQETQLSTNVFWSTTYSDLRTEHLVTYVPNGKVTPIVTFGESLTSRNTISSMAKSLESQGYRVVAGLNGDFYNVNTGLPVGVVITDGEIRTSDAGSYGIGFRADGTAVIGKPGIKVQADLGYGVDTGSGSPTQVVRSLSGVNKARVSTGGVYLYTHEFNSRHTTGNTEPGVDVLCTIVEGSLSVGGTLKVRADQILEASAATPIAPGQVVLSVNLQSEDYYVNALRNIPQGAELSLTAQAADPAWNDVQHAIGALYSLVEDGKMVPGLENTAAPRTAVGQKADGTLVFYTIDGRKKGHSIGATLRQVAARMMELGCVNVLGLDGGGSTMLTVTMPDAWSAKTVNIPSEGRERAVSNQIFLVAENTPSGVLHHFYVMPEQDYVLAGSRVKISASPVDTNFLPMAAQEYTLETTAGTLEGDVLRTPEEGGDVVVTARGGGQEGSAVVHAIQTPDAITVRDSSGGVVKSLVLEPGQTVSLTPSAVYRHMALKADADAFTWTVNGSIGTADHQGAFTAGSPGSGSLTIAAGGKSLTIPVTVSQSALKTVEDFESGSTILQGEGQGMDLSQNQAADQVRMGRGSGKLTYQLLSENGGQAQWTASTPAAVGGGYTGLSLWVRGDGSGNVLELLGSDGSQETVVLRQTLNFTGWKQVKTERWGEQYALTGLRISGPDGTTPRSGTIYLDQIVATFDGLVDQEVPAVTLTQGEEGLTGSVRDAVDGVLPRSSVRAEVDGRETPFHYDEATGALAIPFTADGAAHRVTVTARDASGNLGRASLDLPAAAGSEHYFTDLDGYWGAAYVDFLYTAKITTGYQDGSFRPNQNITRAQFSVMLARYLGLDLSAASGTLPFADAQSIPEYARAAISALYERGIVNGSRGADGALYFRPGDSLTRAQAAAMIGRTQEKGYASGPLNFTDAQSIPEYARPYIQTMSAQGVIGGYQDGSFRPHAKITRGQMAKILYHLL